MPGRIQSERLFVLAARLRQRRRIVCGLAFGHFELFAQFTHADIQFLAEVIERGEPVAGLEAVGDDVLQQGRIQLLRSHQDATL